MSIRRKPTPRRLWGLYGFASAGNTYAITFGGSPFWFDWNKPFMPHRFFDGTWWWEFDEAGEPIAYFNVEGSTLPGKPIWEKDLRLQP